MKVKVAKKDVKRFNEILTDFSDWMEKHKAYEQGKKEEKIRTGRIKKRSYENGRKKGQKERLEWIKEATDEQINF